MQNLYQKICNLNLLSWLNYRLSHRDKPFWSAFTAVFLALNLIFLYHGAHFLFGDHDWKYLKYGLPLNAGLFEGRFSQFILINLLSQGELLPIINNMLGFAGYALGFALLSRYWRLPHNKTSYICFSLTAAITPYILSFMYFAFLIAPVLSWNAFIIAALIISEKEQTFSVKKTLLAVLLITLALGGYPPVINLIAVALTTRLFLAFSSEKKKLSSIFKSYIWSVINIIIALIIYKLCLIYLTHAGAIDSNYYNLQTTPPGEWLNKALLVLKDMFRQFSITLPFITSGYKSIISALSLLSLFTISALSVNKTRRLISLLLFFAILLASQLTLFISTSVTETEFSPRIDFFGFMYVIAAFFALGFKINKIYLKNLTFILALLSLIISIENLFTAQKVWHLGFSAEMKFYQRIGKRFQSNQLFNPNNHYIIVQGGTPSFRSRFYSQNYRKQSDDLLNISYVPGLASGVMWNYYAPHEYSDTTSYVYSLKPDTEIKQKLQTAKPWPAAESVSIGGYWILLTLTPDGLEELRRKYLRP